MPTARSSSLLIRHVGFLQIDPVNAQESVCRLDSCGHNSGAQADRSFPYNDKHPVLAYPGRKLVTFFVQHWVNGGAYRDRTDDLKLAKLPLSQLS